MAIDDKLTAETLFNKEWKPSSLNEIKMEMTLKKKNINYDFRCYDGFDEELLEGLLDEDDFKNN